tara:strand:+ start:904 stop:1104 length:201 start_codon:yes stop_codon:yes gene_type:complete
MGIAWSLGSKLFIIFTTFLLIRVFGKELSGMTPDEISVVLVMFLFFTSFVIAFTVLMDRKRRVPIS